MTEKYAWNQVLDSNRSLSDKEAAYESELCSNKEEDFGHEPGREKPEPKPPDIAWTSPCKPVHMPKPKAHSNYDYRFTNEPRLYAFSGDCREYLQWEYNMDEYLRYHSIPREDRLSYCLGELYGDAEKWWYQEDDYRWYHKEPPISTWGQLKLSMRKKYAPQARNKWYHDLTQKRKDAYLPMEATQKNASSNSAKCQAHQPPNRKDTISANSSQQKRLSQGSAKKGISSGQTEVSYHKELQSIRKAFDEIVHSFNSIKGERNQTSCCDIQLNRKSEIMSTASNENVQVKSSQLVCNTPMTSITHLPFSKDVETGIGFIGGQSKQTKLKEKIKPGLSALELEPPDLKPGLSALKIEPPDLGKSSKPLEKPELICYRCHGIGHMAKACPTKRTNVKTKPLQNILGYIQVSEAQILSKYWSNFLLNQSLKNYVFEFSISSIMHLFLSLSVSKGTGTIEEYKGVEEAPSKPTNLLGQHQRAEKRNKSSAATTSVEKELSPRQSPYHKAVRGNPWQGVIASTLIKEEPPDAHMSRQKNFGQGKYLNPLLIQDTNLLYLGAGKIVSRSKPFQEGEYDEVIKSSYTKEPGINIPGEEKINRENTKETYKQNSVQTKVKIKEQSPISLCGVNPTTLEFTTKKNQPKRSSHEEVIKDTIRPIYKAPNEDMRSVQETFRTNQKEPGYKPDIFGNYTQPGIVSNWNHIKIRSGLKVIQLLIRLILHLPYLESPGFMQLQTRLWRPGDTSTPSRDTPRGSGKSSSRSSISGTCHHSRPSQHFRTMSPLTAVPAFPAYVSTIWPFQHSRTVSPPSSHSSTSRPYHHSRPRPSFLDCATTNQPFHQFRTLSPLMAAPSIPGMCHQRLLLSFCVLKTHPMNLDTPRHHSFPPKLSRLKSTTHSPFSGTNPA